VDQPIPAHVAERIDFAGPCWEWTGWLNEWGYGRAYIATRVENRTVWKSWKVHRLVWTLLVGEIPKGLTLDHLCRNHACCNPDHLEPVTNRVNVLRGYGPSARQARQTHCKRGHEFTPENTYRQKGRNSRACRICRNPQRARCQ
jgi:hypothetical protein